MSNLTFRKSLTAAAVAATLGFPTLALAQETNAGANEDVERIQVTGSRIKRTDMETASPISVFSAEDLEASGFTTVEKFIHNLPSVNGGMQGSNINNGSDGSATVSLRGLGAGRTLLLVNGRRTAYSDMNSIPMAYIERIEVLRDGASTVYGSDAIAGVVNFITKKNFEGAEFTAQYDLTGQGDGETTKISGTIGTSTEKGNVVLSLEYTNRNEVWQGDREFSECPLFDDGEGGTYCGGSGTTSMGTWTTASGSYSNYVVDPDTGEIRPFVNATDGFNYAAVSYMVTPQEVFSINGSATYELTRDVTAFLEGGFTNRQSDQLMGAEGTFWGQFVPGNHPNNPVGEDLYVNRRLEESGGRAFTQDFSDYRMVAGFEGFMDNGWSWDVSYNYTRYVSTIIDYGRANAERFLTLTDPDACDADAECPGLWNPFSPGTLTQEMQDYAFLPNSPVSRGQTKQFLVNLTGDLGGFHLPAGPIGWAVGGEKRWESSLYQPDGAALIGEIYSVAGEATSGSYDVTEAYVETNIPLLAGLPGVESLVLSAAVRSSNYSFLDSTTNSKLGIEYTPFDGLLLRATQADGFRAPSITELYAPQQESNLPYSEPCTNWATGSQSQVVKDNCASEGLPGDFELASNQSASLVGGNPELGPEESDSFTAGIVYTPDALDNFSIAIDYFDIEITNAVGTAGTDNIVNACYNSVDFSSPTCDLILGAEAMDRPSYPGSSNRDVLGAIAGILTANENLATFKTSGFDFDANYNVQLAGGILDIGLKGTYLDDYLFTPFSGGEELQYAGHYAADQWENTISAFSEYRANLKTDYRTDNWSASWTARYMSGTEDLNPKESNTSNYAGSVVYHDVQGTYYFDDDYEFSLGVRNLFDTQPPYVTNNNDSNTLSPSYDLTGAYMYARFVAKF